VKKTFWYAMQTSTTSILSPQLEEDITEAVWLKKEEVVGLYSQMFSTVKSTIENYFA
jgi:hypothetical protein